MSKFPKVGSVISYTYGSFGHTAIVVDVVITDYSAGDATIKVMEQNASATGLDTDTMDNWGYTAHSVYAVKDWITPE